MPSRSPMVRCNDSMCPSSVARFRCRWAAAAWVTRLIRRDVFLFRSPGSSKTTKNS